jgi:hypothetical protein
MDLVRIYKTAPIAPFIVTAVNIDVVSLLESGIDDKKSSAFLAVNHILCATLDIHIVYDVY